MGNLFTTGVLVFVAKPDTSRVAFAINEHTMLHRMSLDLSSPRSLVAANNRGI